MFAYTVTADRASYTLRLHRALKHDYVLNGAILTSPWQRLLTSLEDEILRRSGHILSGYIDQWALQHASTLPLVDDVAAPRGAWGGAPDRPQDPTGGSAMQPAAPRAPTLRAGAGGVYILTIHLHSGDFQAGGTAPSPAAPRAVRLIVGALTRVRSILMTRRTIVAFLATAIFALLLAVAAPQPAGTP